MRTQLTLPTVAAIISLLAGCEKPIPVDHPTSIDLNKPSYSEHATIPFNAYFSTTFTRNVIPEGHTDLQGNVLQLVQTGTGTDYELGYFRISLTCCWSLTDCVPGRSGGTLTDGIGNTIYIKCMECLSPGELTADFPADQVHITGKFEFIGGTGLYDGVTGEGTIDASVTNDGKVTAMTHHWQGYFKIPGLH